MALAGLGSTLLLAVPSAARGEDARGEVALGSCDERTVDFHERKARSIIDRIYRHERWDEAHIGTRKQGRKWRKERDCIADRETREKISDYKAKAEESRDKWRRREELEFRKRHLPYDCGSPGWFAIPCAIVACESRYDFKAKNSSSTAGGVYQIIDSTWYRNGGKEYDSRWPAAEASPREQHVVGRRVWEREGRGSWECRAPAPRSQSSIRKSYTA